MPTILVADDVSFCRELFALALQQAGYTVLAAADGREALNFLTQHPVDLLILDARMPVLDGLGVLRALRLGPDHPAHRKTPVFLLTAVEERQQILKAAQLGANEYILKSHFALADILARLKKYLPDFHPSTAAFATPTPGTVPVGQSEPALVAAGPANSTIKEIWGTV